MLLHLIYWVVLSGFIMLPSLGNAFEAFGFKSGISAKEVESRIRNAALGDLQWEMEGTAIRVNKPDNSGFFLFQFCNDRLFGVSQLYPANFEKMASFVDDTIKYFGDPIIVSALGEQVLPNDLSRQINMHWQLNKRDGLMFTQFDTGYLVHYRTKNDCVKVSR